MGFSVLCAVEVFQRYQRRPGVSRHIELRDDLHIVIRRILCQFPEFFLRVLPRTVSVRGAGGRRPDGSQFVIRFPCLSLTFDLQTPALVVRKAEVQFVDLIFCHVVDLALYGFH